MSANIFGILLRAPKRLGLALTAYLGMVVGTQTRKLQIYFKVAHPCLIKCTTLNRAHRVLVKSKEKEIGCHLGCSLAYLYVRNRTF